MDSRANPATESNTDIRLYLPLIFSSGSNANANIKMLTGTKDTIKTVDNMTTIFAALRLRSEPCESLETVLRHLVPFLRLATSIAVHTLMMINAANGITKLLTAYETLWTTWPFPEETRLRRVLFLSGKNTESSLLTAYSGAAHVVRIMKIPITMVDTFFGVMILFTCESK